LSVPAAEGGDKPVRAQSATAAAGANDLELDPRQGLAFVVEPGARIAHEGFEPASEPDCQVFQTNGKTVYRMWWTTRRYDGQKATGENRWSSHVSVSTDGLDFRYERGPEFRSGRITNRTDRDLIRLPDGGWRAYTLIGGGNPWYCVDSYLADEQARNWKWEPGIRVNFGQSGDWDTTAVRAPEAVLLKDGRIRVYYIGWNGASGPYASDKQPGERWRIVSAVSADGLDFVKEPGVRIDVDPDANPPHGEVAMAKPLVVRLTDGRWRMYFAALSVVDGDASNVSQTRLLLSAVSSDGLGWRREPGVRLFNEQGAPASGWYPSLVRTAKGALRLYYDNGAIRSAVERSSAQDDRTRDPVP
jgi:hypothetical protein